MNINLIPPLGPEALGPSSAAPARSQTAADPSRTQHACQEFEAFFTAQLFSAMTQNLELGQKDDIQGQQEKWIWSLVGQTVAREISQQHSLGLGRQVLESLKTQKLQLDKP